MGILTFGDVEIVCIGGGAASFFFAANVAKVIPDARITILEQGRNVLGKVAISGGGRCNVTTSCFDPAQLIQFYPRGGQKLRKPFEQFGPRDMVTWLKEQKVDLKTEDDGRMFPASNSSETIVSCLTQACERNGVKVRKGAKVKRIVPHAGGTEGYTMELLDSSKIKADKIFIGAGGSKQVWQMLEHLGHKIIAPVPSLFSFVVNDQRLQGLAGLSVSDVIIRSIHDNLESRGPLLITHKGLSGPAILKLSAFGARAFHESDYRFEIEIDFKPELDAKAIKGWRDAHGKSLLKNTSVIGLPKRLAVRLLDYSALDTQKKYATLSNAEMLSLQESLKKARFQVTGQNRFKEEFVTAGGVDLEEIDLNDFSSRLFPNMLLAGEVINIDAVTGGFNFQAAWTGAYLAAQGLAR